VMQKNALKQGDDVIIVDDFFSTGGSIQAAAQLVKIAGATVKEAAFLINNLDVPSKVALDFSVFAASEVAPRQCLAHQP